MTIARPKTGQYKTDSTILASLKTYSQDINDRIKDHLEAKKHKNQMGSNVSQDADTENVDPARSRSKLSLHSNNRNHKSQVGSTDGTRNQTPKAAPTENEEDNKMLQIMQMVQDNS
jgi:hypothetical protein